MSNPQGKTDPLEQWRGMRDAYMDIWAKASGEAVNSDAYAQATGAMLEAFLTSSSPYRDAQKKAMISALEQCNMPSRDDYLRLADRMSNLEFLLDDMDARLRQVYHMLARTETRTVAVCEGPPPPRADAKQSSPQWNPLSSPKTPKAHSLLSPKIPPRQHSRPVAGLSM